MDHVRLSKRLSFVLRHRPDSIGLQLDAGGWADVDVLLAALAAHGTDLSRATLERVVAGSDKQRFSFDSKGLRVRASQGHSVPVELGYVAQPPPEVLFHGTPLRHVPAILEQGLRAGRRHAVHLSPDERTARTVGARRGRCAVLRIDARALARTGTEFTCSDNGVWLIAAVPARFLSVIGGDVVLSDPSGGPEGIRSADPF